MDWGLRGRVSVLNASISHGEDHGIHWWWDLIRSKQLSSRSVCRAQVFAGFSGRGNSIHNTQCLFSSFHIEDVDNQQLLVPVHIQPAVRLACYVILVYLLSLSLPLSLSLSHSTSLSLSVSQSVWLFFLCYDSKITSHSLLFLFSLFKTGIPAEYNSLLIIINIFLLSFIISTQPLRSGRIWHKVIFKRCLTGLNSEFFLLPD